MAGEEQEEEEEQEATLSENNDLNQDQDQDQDVDTSTAIQEDRAELNPSDLNLKRKLGESDVSESSEKSIQGPVLQPSPSHQSPVLQPSPSHQSPALQPSPPHQGPALQPSPPQGTESLAPPPPSRTHSSSVSLMSTLDVRREQIKDILNGKASNLHQLDGELKAKIQKNREDRVSLARQLNELHESHKAKERRRIEVERELGSIQRQNLVNDIMYRKQLQADYRAQLETIESNELLLLKKLEAIDEERAHRQAAKIASVQEIHDRFAHVMDILHIEESDGKKQVERVAAGGSDNLDVALARELQRNISVKYQNKADQSTEARHLLTKERFEVESQLQSRTGRLLQLPQVEDEAGTEVPYVYGQDPSEVADFKAQMSLHPRPREETGKNTRLQSVLLTQAQKALAPHPPDRTQAKSTPYKNYSFKNMLKQAKEMDNTVKERVDLHQIRLEELKSELDWVKLGPQTEQWKKVTARSSRPPQISKSKALLDHFVATQESRAEHRSLEDDDSAVVACANIIYLEVLEEGCAETAKLAAQELLSVRVGVQRLLETLIVQSVSGLSEEDRTTLQLSGKSHLLRGCTRDIKASTARHREGSSSTIQTLRQKSGKLRSLKRLFPGKFSVESDIVAETCPTRTQRLIFGNQVTVSDGQHPPPFYNQFYSDYQKTQYASVPLERVNKGKRSHVDNFPKSKKIALWEHMLELDDVVAREDLISREASHFDGLTLLNNPSSRIELPVPSELKGLCLLRCFARANKCLSLLVMAAKNGRFAVYSVPWQGSSHPGDFQSNSNDISNSRSKFKSKEDSNDVTAPTLVCLSPSIFPTEVSPIVDIQETTLPSNQLVSLDSKGAIRVWCLNPISKRKAHSSSMFSRLYSKYNHIYATCMFYITPVEFNLPKPTPLSFFNQLRGATKGRRGGTSGDDAPSSVPQKGTFPQKIMLLPSATTLSGRTPSLLVGTAAGDVFKINMDFKEKYFAPKFIYPKSFVDVEFMHSASVTKDAGNKKSIAMILAAADKRKAAKGKNPVYRELFHYHTAPIVLLECVGKVNTHILSIDAEGKVALWAYSPELFENQGWFRPLRTAVLDLRYLTLTQLKVSTLHPLPPQTPHPDLEPLLQLMQRKVVRDEIVETFQPIRGVPGHPRKLEVQYQRHTAMNIPVSKSIDQLVYWSASNVTSSLLSSGVLDVKMTQDGEEVVLLMTYEGLLDDGSGNVNLALTELQRAESLRLQREARMSRTFNSSISRPYSSFGESGDYSTMGYDDSLDEDSLVDKAALDQLDIVTDSEEEDEGEVEQNNMQTSRHVADDFEFWMRDRDEQRASLKSLDLENAHKDLKKAVEPQNNLARDISTIIDHEKHKLYGATVNPTWNNNFTEEDFFGDEDGDAQLSKSHRTTMFAVVACLNLESWKFHTPLVQFTLQPHELVMGMHLGPVQSQTLTRAVFVQTTNQMRVFSLETGNEVISKHVPIVLSSLSKSKKQFKPLLGALCPLQSLIALGCAAQSTVVINKIDVLVPDDNTTAFNDGKASHDGLPAGLKASASKLSIHSEQEESRHTLPLSAVLGLKRKAHRLRRVVHDMYVPQTVSTVNSSAELSPWLMETIAEILDDVFNGIWDLKKEHSRGKNAVAVLGEGTKLGVISPTLWPDPAILRAELARERGDPGKLNVMMAVYRGAGKFKRRKETLNSEGERSHDSSSDDSSSEGVSSEYETDYSSTSDRSVASFSGSSVADEVAEHQSVGGDSDDGRAGGVCEPLEKDNDGDHDESNVDEVPEHLEDHSGDERLDLHETIIKQDQLLSVSQHSDSPPKSDRQHSGSQRSEASPITCRRRSGSQRTDSPPKSDRRLSGSQRRDSSPISDITRETVEGDGDGRGSYQEESDPRRDENSQTWEGSERIDGSSSASGRRENKTDNEDTILSSRRDTDDMNVRNNIGDGDSNIKDDLSADDNDAAIDGKEVVVEAPAHSTAKKSSRWGWGRKK